MIAAVIPARNEVSRISSVLETLDKLPINLIVPVVNGSADGTLEAVINKTRSLKKPVLVIFSEQPFGHDVPRAVGARFAWEQKMNYVLFIDGDMDGELNSHLSSLIKNTVNQRLDMSLSDCYLNTTPDNSLAELLVYFRCKLNQKIGLAKALGSASPSHGPIMISRKLMNSIPFRELAIPPVSLSMSAKLGLKIDIGVRLPPECLGIQYRNPDHSVKMSKMIIGDCIEAINVYDEKPRNRVLYNRNFLGFHLERNWNLLDVFLSQRRL